MHSLNNILSLLSSEYPRECLLEMLNSSSKTDTEGFAEIKSFVRALVRIIMVFFDPSHSKSSQIS